MNRNVRGLYVGAKWLASVRRDVFDRLLQDAVRAGLNTVFTLAEAIHPERAEHIRHYAMRIFGTFHCYSDHALPAAQKAEARPTDAEGNPFMPMEWYIGVTPTDAAFNVQLDQRWKQALGNRMLDGLMLDFIRWPLHWELELRAGAIPRRSSYDAETLRAYAVWSDNQIAADEPAAAAAILEGRLASSWQQFKTNVITRRVAQLADSARRARGPTFVLGAFIVPAPESIRQSLLGQDLGELAALLDLLAPMTYHGILKRDAHFIVDTSREMSAVARRIAPMLQLSSSRRYSGEADWGNPIALDELSAALDELGTDFPEFILFPADALNEPLIAVLQTHISRSRLEVDMPRSEGMQE